jgi:HAD superfamily hydrolase (TIGR01509 family)
MIKAVIFDVDGLLLDSEPIWSLADRELLRRRGIDYHDELKTRVVGKGQVESAQNIKDYYKLEDPIDELVMERRKLLNELLKANLQLMPGAQELIDTLFENGFRLAIASSQSKEIIDLVLKSFALEEKFSTIVYGDEVKRGKPEPDIFLLAAQRLGVSPQEAVVLEDSNNGAIAAKKAGMKVIVTPNQYNKGQAFPLADLVVEKLADITPEDIRRL